MIAPLRQSTPTGDFSIKSFEELGRVIKPMSKIRDLKLSFSGLDE